MNQSWSHMIPGVLRGPLNKVRKGFMQLSFTGYRMSSPHGQNYTILLWWKEWGLRPWHAPPTKSKCFLGQKSQGTSFFYLIFRAILNGPSEYSSWWSGRSKMNMHMASPPYGCAHVSSNFPFELLWRDSEDRQKAFLQCECEHVSLGWRWWGSGKGRRYTGESWRDSC